MESYTINEDGVAREMTPEEVAAYKATLPPFPAITARQFDLEMIANGYDDDLEALIATKTEAEQKIIRAELKANEYLRESPFIESLGTLLGLSSDQIDTMWRSAVQR